MSEFMNIPIGFRFDPTDEELISGFLLRKVTGLPLPWNGFLERDLYGENTAPWNVFGDIHESSLFWHTRKEGENSKVTKKTIYVFTKLTKISSSSNSKRISRRAGCGTWNGQTSPRKIKDSNNGKIIGSTRMLTFQHSKTSVKSSSDTANFGHWIMHEYSLDGASLLGGRNSHDLVLCKITKCLRENDGRRMQQPEPPQFCISMSGNGGASDIQISTTTGSYEGETCNKRCAEERHHDHKKQKYEGDYDESHILLEGVNMVPYWDIEALPQGLWNV